MLVEDGSGSSLLELESELQDEPGRSEDVEADELEGGSNVDEDGDVDVDDDDDDEDHVRLIVTMKETVVVDLRAVCVPQ